MLRNYASLLILVFAFVSSYRAVAGECADLDNAAWALQESYAALHTAPREFSGHRVLADQYLSLAKVYVYYAELANYCPVATSNSGFNPSDTACQLVELSDQLMNQGNSYLHMANQGPNVKAAEYYVQLALTQEALALSTKNCQ